MKIRRLRGCPVGEAPKEMQEPVRIPISEELDLHPFLPRDVAAVTEDYLVEAARCGLRQVRVIHGRGAGVDRRRIHSLLERLEEVESWEIAAEELGGSGATLVRLRRR